MLAQILGFLANGQGVTITPSNAMLTTQQAADFLNVSRPYLIKLLEAGQIQFEKVGTHRRMAFGELVEYKGRDDQQRRRAADELTELGQELGELEPMPFVVVYDANALYGNAQRDLLIRIAQSGLVQAKWTDEIRDDMLRRPGKHDRTSSPISSESSET